MSINIPIHLNSTPYIKQQQKWQGLADQAEPILFDSIRDAEFYPKSQLFVADQKKLIDAIHLLKDLPKSILLKAPTPIFQNRYHSRILKHIPGIKAYEKLRILERHLQALKGLNEKFFEFSGQQREASSIVSSVRISSPSSRIQTLTSSPRNLQSSNFRYRLQRDLLYLFHSAVCDSTSISVECGGAATYIPYYPIITNLKKFLAELNAQKGNKELTKSQKKSLEKHCKRLEKIIPVVERGQKLSFINTMIENGSSYRHLNSMAVSEIIKTLVDMPTPKEDASEAERLDSALIFSAGIQSHAILYEIQKEADGTYSFTIVNTGSGILFNHKNAWELENVLKLDARFYDRKYTGLSAEDFQVGFIHELIMLSKNSNSMNELYDFVDHYLLKNGKQSIGRLHKTQGHGSCSFKCLMSWIHKRLGKDLIRQFKVFMNKNLIDEFDEVFRKGDKLEALEERPDNIDKPESFMEVLSHWKSKVKCLLPDSYYSYSGEKLLYALRKRGWHVLKKRMKKIPEKYIWEIRSFMEKKA